MINKNKIILSSFVKAFTKKNVLLIKIATDYILLLSRVNRRQDCYFAMSDSFERLVRMIRVLKE